METFHLAHNRIQHFDFLFETILRSCAPTAVLLRYLFAVARATIASTARQCPSQIPTVLSRFKPVEVLVCDIHMMRIVPHLLELQGLGTNWLEGEWDDEV